MAISEPVKYVVRNESNSKSAKKKKAAKSLTMENPSTSPIPQSSRSNGVSHSNHSDGPHENPYIRELQKSIRNVNKKLLNASKVDNVIADNPDRTLDELVAARKINADQKAQILKKPALQTLLAQLEEQIAQYLKLDSEFKSRSQNEKANLEKKLKELASKQLEESVASAKAETQEIARKNLEESLLLLSQFLKLAAIRRAEEEAAELEESKALEGLLAQVYTGDENAVAAMLNLIYGSDKTLKSVNGEDLNVTYATLKAASIAQVPYMDKESQIGEPESITKNEFTDLKNPIIEHAGITEIKASSKVEIKDLQTKSDQIKSLQNSVTVSGSTNFVSEANGDAGNDLSQSQEWVEVPYMTQKETVSNSNVTGTSKLQSWADDQPEIAAEVSSSQVNTVGDGFQEIHRSRGGRIHRGVRTDGHRGHGNGRGEGYRGRGRGRGGHRGGRRSDD